MLRFATLIAALLAAPLPSLAQGVVASRPSIVTALNLRNVPAGTFSHWNLDGVTKSAAMAGPDGAASAYKLIDTAAAGFHRINRNVAVTINTGYMFEVIVKAAGRAELMLNGVFAAEHSAIFDVNACTSSAPSGLTSVATVSLGGGWCYLAIGFNTGAADTAGTVQIYLRSAASNTFTGDGTSGAIVHNARFFAGGW